MTNEVQAAAARLLPPGPWSYMPIEHDDWGYVRDANGKIVADTCTVAEAGEFREATKYGTAEYWRGPPQSRTVAELLIRARELVREDDGEAIAPEWLKSVGGKPNTFTDGVTFWHDQKMGRGDKTIVLDIKPTIASFAVMSDGSREVWWYIPAPKTRGDVRRLCDCLGIPLAESPSQEKT